MDTTARPLSGHPPARHPVRGLLLAIACLLPVALPAGEMDRYWRPEVRILPPAAGETHEGDTGVGHIRIGARAPRAPVRALPVAATPAREIAWSYDGEGGPEHWGSLRPDYGLCASGRRQSPVDASDAIRVELMPIDFHYVPAPLRISDDGHTLQVALSGSTLEVNGRRYTLDGLSFHRPAEARLDGITHDMSAQLLHHDDDGHLAMVTILLDRGAANPLLQTLLNHLPLESGVESRLDDVLINPALLLPGDRRYVSLLGSLTTPPCSEGVLHLILAQPVTLSEEQLAIFARLHGPNARPLQPVNGRVILGPR